MSDGALTVLDGNHLRAIDTNLPKADVSLTGAQVLDLADSKASSSLFSLSLPEIKINEAAVGRVANLAKPVSFPLSTSLIFSRSTVFYVIFLIRLFACQ